MVSRKPATSPGRQAPALAPRRGPGLCAGACCGAALVAVLVLGGCQERIDERFPDRMTGTPAVPHPTVQIDLQDLQEQGILRMITLYNSSGYFIHKGGQAGFDYELMKRFAQEQGLSLQSVVPEPGEDLVSLLNSGQGDVVATGLVLDPGLESWVTWTRPTNFVHKVVVWQRDQDRKEGLAGLAGLKVFLPHGDPFRSKVLDLRDESTVHFFVGAGLPGAHAEDLLAEVANGELDAVVVDDVLAKAAMSYLPDIELGPTVGERMPTVWLVRHNSPELRASLNAFLKKHIRVGPDGETRRSQTYGIIYDRYFENPVTIRGFQVPEHRPDKSGRISAYDELIRRRTETLDLDWRMVAALIYQESRFYPFARSKAGAQGLMQVLPRFAGDQADSLFEAAANLRAGLRLMQETYSRYAYLDSLDRWRFTLAEYHAGNGHVTDARRLAMDLGRDPNRWEGGLAETLPLLMQRKYYENLRYGYYRGAETVAYVEEILNRYRMYTRLVPRSGAAAPDSVDSASALAAPARGP